MELIRSDSAQIIWFILWHIAISLPYILVWFIGIAVALINLSKNKKLSIPTIIALIIFLLEWVSGVVLSYLPLTRALSPEQIGYIFVIAGVIRAFASALAFALLLWAIWGERYFVKK